MNPASVSNGWQYRLVRDAPGLTSTARLVGHTLATYCNRLTGIAVVRVETLVAATGLGRRTVQRALRELEAAGVVGIAPSARRCRGYAFAEGRHTGAPSEAEGRHTGASNDDEGRHTGALEAPHRRPEGATLAPGTIEGTLGGTARLTPRKARASKPDPYPRPAGVPAQAWADFLTNRRRKKMPNTASAYKRLLDDLDRLVDDDWPPGRLVEFAASRGWCGIYDPRTTSHERTDDRQRPQFAGKSTANAAAIARANLGLVPPG